MTFFDQQGRRLDLDGRGHSGGEGTVHRISGDVSRVAKIYHPGRLNAALQTKLRVMLLHPPAEPQRGSHHRSIAWVDGLVFADASAHDFRGFTMPYVDTDEFRQSHVYYDAADRLRVFGGEFTWRHLLFAAHNLASAVAAVHAAGHRVGDLRETNLLVAPSALVTLIDCDSFQITDPRTMQVHPTRVATGDYLAPELQGVDFRNVTPDRYHGDLFALAVLVFRFLMLGSHPFQSKGPAVEDAPTTEAKIKKGVFAFAGRRKGAEPPEYAPAYSILPAAVQDLFVRAFVRGHSDPGARPSAAEWAGALEQEGRRLRECAANTNHWHTHRLRSCPWCRISPDPFPVRIAVGHQIALNGAAAQVPETARVEQLRAYTRVALVDGGITDSEFWYLRSAGGELGLRTAVIDRVVDEESRKVGPAKPSQPMRSAQPSQRMVLHPSALLRPVRDRRVRAAWKAAAPILALGAVAGALAPVVAPVIATIGVLPALAVAGEMHTRRGWRTRAKAPLNFAIHLHRALGNAARLFVPLVVLGAALSYVPYLHADWIAQTMGALAVAALTWLVIARLPFSGERSSASLRAGRDLVWRSLVGDSGRMRKPGYALWAVCVGGGAALAANHALWWPLTLR